MPGRSDASCTNNIRSHVWQKDTAHFKYALQQTKFVCCGHTENAPCLFDTRTVVILFVPSASELIFHNYTKFVLSVSELIFRNYTKS
jgi:hypothetical protein